MGRLDRLPGIDEGNPPIKNAGIGAVYVILVLFVLVGLTGVGMNVPDDGSPAPPVDDGEDATGTDGTLRSDDPTLLSMAELSDHDEPYFDGRHESFGDTGDAVTDAFGLDGGFTAVIYEHAGDGDFSLELYDAENDELVAELTNETGDASGATGVPLSGGGYYVDVAAAGDWSVAIAQPFTNDASIRVPPAGADGDGRAVLGPLDVDGEVTASGEQDGAGTFTVELVEETAMNTDDVTTVFDETGEFDGQERVSHDGVSWVVVDADGEWSIEFED